MNEFLCKMSFESREVFIATILLHNRVIAVLPERKYCFIVFLLFMSKFDSSYYDIISVYGCFKSSQDKDSFTPCSI